LAEYKILNFDCEEDLSKYKESLLFDAGESVAGMTIEFKNGFVCEAELAVRGDVRIALYDSEEGYVRYTQDYSPELRTAIENGEWDKIDIGNNNWFEMLYTLKDAKGNEIASDGDVYEEDISKHSPETLKESMLDYSECFAKYYIDKDKNKEALDISKGE